MLSMPYGESGIHACVHVWWLAGLPEISSECSEHKARVAAPFHQLCRVGIMEAHLRAQTKEHTARQRCKL